MDWTIVQGSIPALQSSTTRTQGAKSLAIKAKGFVVVKSAAFPVTTAVAGPIVYDLFLPNAQPNPFWFGASQLYIDCPSKSVFNAFIGQRELTGLPTGVFSTLSFDLPTYPGTQLAGGCSDLSFKIAINVPSNATGTYLLDNLHFRGSGGDVKATLDCVVKRGNGAYTAYFGYVNRESFPVVLPVGPDNNITPSPPPRQPTTFATGTQKDAVSVDFQAGQTVTWHLPGGNASAKSTSPLCPGSAPTNVPCVGVPSTTDAGCAVVVRVPNTAGPERDPAALGKPPDLNNPPPPGPQPAEIENEAAIAQTQYLPDSTFSLAPGGVNTISINITEPSLVFVKVLWRTQGSVSLSLQQGSNTVNGTPVLLGAFGGTVGAMGRFTAGAVQARVQNSGATAVTLTVQSSFLPLSRTE